MSDSERATKRVKIEIEEELPATISEEVENKVEETVERAAVNLEDSSVEEREPDFTAISDSEQERFAVSTQLEFGPPQIALLDIQREQDPVQNPEATAKKTTVIHPSTCPHTQGTREIDWLLLKPQGHNWFILVQV